MRRRRRRSREIGRRVLSGLFWIGLITVSAVLALPILIPYALPWLAARYGIAVTVDRAGYVLPGPELRLQGLRLGAEPRALEARDVRVALDGRALLRGELRLTGLALEEGRLTLAPATGAGLGETVGLAGYLPVLPAGVAIPMPDVLELRDVRLVFAEGRLPDLTLESLLLAPGPAGERRIDAAVGLADGAVRLQGALTGNDASGGDLRVRIERLELAPLASLTSAAGLRTAQGRVDGELAVRWPATGGPRTLEGTVEGFDLAAEVAGVRVLDAFGRWEGTARWEPAAEGGTEVRASGRLAADRGAVTTAAGTLEVEGLTFEGQTAWRLAQGQLGDWTLDGDGELAHAAVRDGPRAGAAWRQAAFWGLWRGPRRELSLGQLRVARVDLPVAAAPPARAWPWSVQAEGLQARGLALAAEGLSLDQLGVGPVTLRHASASASITATSVQGTEVVVAPGWARAGSVTVEGLAAPSSRPEVGLQVATIVLQGARAGAGEGTHLGEARLRGLSLAVARDGDGEWRGPELPWPAGEPPTVDTVIVAPGARIELTDLSTDPVARLALTEVEGRLAARDRDHPGRFSAHGSLDGARLEVAGQIGAAGTPAPAGLRATLSGAPLPTFSPYLRDRLGWDFARGTVSAEIDARAAAGGWDGRARLALSRAEVVPARGSGEGSAWLARGLRLLADGEGRAEVGLAIGSGAALGPALREALVTAVESAFGAIGLTRAQAGALLREGAVTLPGLALDAQGQPDPAASARLEALASVLRRHPAARVEICGPEAEPGTGTGPSPGEAGAAAAPAAVERVREVLTHTGRVGPDRIETCSALPPAARLAATPAVGVILRVAP